MRIEQAAALIAPAVRRTDAAWADLGAGSGTFTRALASLLPKGARVVTVERDAAAVAALRATADECRRGDGVTIDVVQADFTRPLTLPPLDGALLANSLHYVPPHEQLGVLRTIAHHVRSGGRLAIVEYERRGPDPWVPYPVPLQRLEELAIEAELGPVERLGARASRYGGVIYAAMAAIGEPRQSDVVSAKTGRVA